MIRSRAHTLRMLAVDDLQLLLGAEPELAKAFRVLAKRAHSTELRIFCRQGVTYTLRRVRRVEKALRLLDAPLQPRNSSGLAGLIGDAQRASSRRRSPAADVALLGTIERISHFGLAIYTTVDRHLRQAEAPEARRILIPSTKEKREAIAEMSRMARRKLIPRLDHA